MKWTNDFLDRKRKLADPLADDIIRELIESNGENASRELFEELITDIDLPIAKLPPGIQKFLTKTAKLPDWLSGEDLNQSNLLFKDHGPKMLLLLYFKSLPLLYSDIKGAQVLWHTSRLTHSEQSLEIFARRIAETGQFLLNVMANDNFSKSSTAIITIRKVRLIHAAIRQFAGKNWDTEKYGIPINQEDLALTLMTFSVSLIDGLKQLSIEVNEHQIAAYFERWKAIGLLLGIDENILPENIDDGRMLINIILKRNMGTSEAGILLTKALVEFSKNAIPGNIFDVAPETLIEYFTGSEISGHLGIKNQAGCFGFGVPALLVYIFNLGEKIEGDPEKINYIANKLSSKLMEAMVNYFDKYKERHFEIPDEFRIWFA